jgi:hypothetical protein
MAKIIYVIFQKEPDHDKMLPRFQVLTEPPNHTHRVYKLEPGECLDAAQIFFVDDNMTCIRIDNYLVSNVDGQAKTDLVEIYYMRYVR